MRFRLTATRFAAFGIWTAALVGREVGRRLAFDHRLSPTYYASQTHAPYQTVVVVDMRGIPVLHKGN